MGNIKKSQRFFINFDHKKKNLLLKKPEIMVKNYMNDVLNKRNFKSKYIVYD